jgi:signal transduction histidine kinase
LFGCYHGIVQEHGGQFAVESKVGKGTTFKIRLSMARLGI